MITERHGVETKMPLRNPIIEALLLINPHSGETKQVFESPLAGTNEAAELWWEAGSANYYLFQTDEYNDEELRDRRNTKNMISPRDSRLHLHFVGLVWGARTYDDNWVLLTRGIIAPSP